MHQEHSAGVWPIIGTEQSYSRQKCVMCYVKLARYRRRNTGRLHLCKMSAIIALIEVMVSRAWEA